MCKDIISEHDYSNDLQNARAELQKMSDDQTDRQQFIEQKKLFQARR